MSSLRAHIPHVEGHASEHVSPEIQERPKTANGISGYRTSMAKEDALRKCLLPVSDNVTSRVWMSRDLSVYSNSEYFYAIFPIAVALFWDRWGREIPKWKPSSMIFTTLTHCLNKTDIDNYFVRTQGHWFRRDTTLKEPPPPGSSRLLLGIPTWA